MICNAPQDKETRDTRPPGQTLHMSGRTPGSLSITERSAPGRKNPYRTRDLSYTLDPARSWMRVVDEAVAGCPGKCTKLAPLKTGGLKSDPVELGMRDPVDPAGTGTKSAPLKSVALEF
jgi:hypothetical protein